MSATKTIGFGGTYYTLWEVYPPEKVVLSDGAWYETQQFVYIQNLAKDLDVAKSKVEGDFVVDLSLKGKRSFIIKGDIQKEEDVLPIDCFQFGKYRGQLIAEVADLDYTRWYYGEVEGDVKQAAKDYILSQGFDFYYQEMLPSDEVANKKYLDSLPRGHFFSPSEKVVVSLKQVDYRSWKGYYGITCLVTYLTECGKVLYYKGSSPLELSSDGYVSVMGTVKHDSWRETYIKPYTDDDALFNATFLQRMKIVK